MGERGEGVGGVGKGRGVGGGGEGGGVAGVKKGINNFRLCGF